MATTRKKLAAKRSLFRELMGGVDAIREHREGRLTPRTHHAEPISLPELEPHVVRETRGPMNQGHSDTMPAETTIALLARASRRHVPQRG
jgi:hypothetical protein